MYALGNEFGRRTTVDEVFDRLHADIVTLKLEPGTRMSEVEVAGQFNISRQPVREAFIRLSNMRLLEIRPQKATLVRKISQSHILNSRFIRTAVEVEVVRRACASKADLDVVSFNDNLARQKQSVANMNVDEFHDLDYAFHRLICRAGDAEFAFDTIASNKAHVDRLCMIQLSSQPALNEVREDHAEIYDLLKKRDEAGTIKLIRHHLSRLDQTLNAARDSHSDYFED
jgi:DNA-binding GntR family transcriptional regulator